MGFIIKPVVTEKMTKITDKSSESKKFSTRSEKIAKANNAEKEVRSYIVKSKAHPEGVKKEKTVYTYTKEAQPKYGFICSLRQTSLRLRRKLKVCTTLQLLT